MGGASASSSATAGRRQRIRRWSKALEPAAPGARHETRSPGNKQGDGDGSAALDGGDGRRATAAVTRCGCRRGEPFEGCDDRVAGKPRRFPKASPRRRARGRPDTNATNPRAGSGAQQTRRPVAEKAVEVVRDHEDGTRSGRGTPGPKAPGAASADRGAGSGRSRSAGGGARSGQGHERRNRRGFVSVARWFQRSRERSEDDAKATRVDRQHFGASGRPSRMPPGIRTGDGPRSRGEPGSPTTGNRRGRRSPHRYICLGASDGPEGPAHVTRAASPSRAASARRRRWESHSRSSL
jgi:hypothetical protein